MTVLEDVVTEFGHIRITRSRSTGICTYYQDRCFHSQADAEGVSTCVYVHVMFSVIRQSLARRVLMIGCAGGTLATMLERVGVRVTVVDINPLSFTIAKNHFKMPESVECVTADGVEYLKKSPLRYDAIAIDAFASDSSIPKEFTSLEFFTSVRDSLAPAGVAVMNVMTASDFDPQADRIALTMQAAGLPSQMFDWQGKKDRNTIVIGGRIEGIRIPSGKEPLWVQRELPGFSPRGPRKRVDWKV